MSKVAIQGNASGSGVLTIAAPNTNSNFTLTIPDATTTIVGTDATQTLTNKSIVATQLTGTIAAARLPAGSVLQVVSTAKTDTFSTGSGSFTDVTGLSANITPSSATSKVFVIVNVFMGGADQHGFQWQIVRTSTAIAVTTSGASSPATGGYFSDTGASNGNTWNGSGANFLDTPNTTSSTTYKIQCRTGGSTAFINRRANHADFGGFSSITLLEIAA